MAEYEKGNPSDFCCSYIKQEAKWVRDEAEVVDGAVYRGKQQEIFIQGNDVAEYTIYKDLSKRNVKMAFKNVKIRSRETNQKDLTNPQERKR